MADSVYRVTEVIGTSTESWEKAAQNAIATAAESVRDLRIAEIKKSDLVVENGQVSSYRVRMDLSFKFDSTA
ncbi:dodecin family protein [Actinomycetospora lemnae]|uniref:Dodecin family protein n=1 Tax=Actinomycetospora lemnae TaxID=3019891 RepID=A0ABT5SVG9_9PSEU|nr:dodecin family protein [Actinomycetospora sp. DW7H6]MDD7966850.1 dodecin family protein [Actinomycetospora sp. DW7H6]